VTKSQTFDHPNPLADRTTQYLGLGVSVLLGGLIAVQIPALLLGFPLLIVILIVVTCVLMLPVSLMWTAATPGVSVSDEGITLHPLIWRDQFVAWGAITQAKPYPLLPSPDTEITRKALVGRRKFKAAEGVMLVIPSLGLPYQCHGLFAGEGFHGAIGLTNRTHRDYERLRGLLPVTVQEAE